VRDPTSSSVEIILFCLERLKGQKSGAKNGPSKNCTLLSRSTIFGPLIFCLSPDCGPRPRWEIRDLFLVANATAGWETCPAARGGGGIEKPSAIRAAPSRLPGLNRISCDRNCLWLFRVTSSVTTTGDTAIASQRYRIRLRKTGRSLTDNSTVLGFPAVPIT
jgi:hypothetical protein